METTVFNPMDIFVLGDEDRKLPYAENVYYDGKVAKCGQMKLLIGEILFLLNHWNTEKYPQITLVVAGGASGEHYSALLDMFPGIERLDMWDGPNRRFALENTEAYEGRVRIIKQLMTKETVGDMYKDLNVFFVSDIRTMSKEGVNLDEMSPETRESTIEGDMRLQEELVRIIDPVECMLKFRVPYPSDDDPLPFISYFKGVIYGQCFSSPHSAEMRLVPVREKGEYVSTRYGKLDFEMRMSYYNNRIRIKRGFVYANSVNGATDINDTRLVSCFDTCYMLYVLDKYLRSVGYDEEDLDKRFTKAHRLWSWALDKVSSYSLSGKFCDMDRYRKLKMMIVREKNPHLYVQRGTLPEPRPLPTNITEALKSRGLSLEPTLSIREGTPLTFRRKVAK